MRIYGTSTYHITEEGKSTMALRRAVRTQRRIPPLSRHKDPACRLATPWRGASLRT